MPELINRLTPPDTCIIAEYIHIEEEEKPIRGSYVVAVYHCEQAWGGPEEGGWWYDTGNLTRIVDTFRTDQAAYEYSRRLNNRLRSRKFGPNLGKREYTSSISTGEYRAQTFEDTAPTYFPESRPRYE